MERWNFDIFNSGKQTIFKKSIVTTHRHTDSQMDIYSQSENNSNYIPLAKPWNSEKQNLLKKKKENPQNVSLVRIRSC